MPIAQRLALSVLRQPFMNGADSVRLLQEFTRDVRDPLPPKRRREIYRALAYDWGFRGLILMFAGVVVTLLAHVVRLDAVGGWLGWFFFTGASFFVATATVIGVRASIARFQNSRDRSPAPAWGEYPQAVDLAVIAVVVVGVGVAVLP